LSFNQSIQTSLHFRKAGHVIPEFRLGTECCSDIEFAASIRKPVELREPVSQHTSRVYHSISLRK
jgi:hypothetical protein